MIKILRKIDKPLFFVTLFMFIFGLIMIFSASYVKAITMLDNAYYYLIRQGSTMNQLNYNRKLECIFDSMDYLQKLYNDNNFYDDYNQELEFIYIEHFLHAGSLRVISYDEGKAFIEKVSKVMKNRFPNWYKNKYFKEQPFKYKVVCYLIYHNKISLLKKLLK